MVAIDQPTMNYGTLNDISLFAGGTLERGLIRFELSSIAPGTLVVAARLELERVDYGDDLVGGLALRLAGEAWTEATATWNERQTGTAWSSGGGTVSAAIATVATPTTTAVVLTVPVTLRQSWIDAPATNFGFSVTGSDEGIDMHYHLITLRDTSRDWPTAARARPCAVGLLGTQIACAHVGSGHPNCCRQLRGDEGVDRHGDHPRADRRCSHARRYRTALLSDAHHRDDQREPRRPDRARLVVRRVPSSRSERTAGVPRVTSSRTRNRPASRSPSAVSKSVSTRRPQ